MTDEKNPRDHGYGSSPEVGTPKILGSVPKKCPHCGCAPIFQVGVVVKDPPAQLRVPSGSEAVGTYIGCAACPWASPMMTVARVKES